MKHRKIVITGGPATGKTVIIDKLEASGHRCFPEIIRSMTLEAKENGSMETINSNPISSVSDPMEFNLKIINARTQQFLSSLKFENDPVFFDRGIPDVLAYMQFFDQPCPLDFWERCKNHKYDLVFLLPPWKDIYIRDNERFETFEEAEQLYSHLEQAYIKSGHAPIIVPTDTVEKRVSFIINRLKNS